MTTYDVIVIGTGGVGSSAAFHLAARGARVLGLDRFTAGHDRGSSHGHTRVIRQAYCEHPDYVPLVRAAYGQWRDLEARCGERLLHQVGLVEVGPPDGVVLPGVYEAARQHDLQVETLDEAELRKRFPGFRLPDGTAAVFEAEAGYLLVEHCVLAYLQQAAACGAELRTQEPVRRWQAEADSVRVTTDRGQYHAKRLVITAGPWAGELLQSLGVPLQVLRKHLYWYANDRPEYRQSRGCPTFLFELPHAIFYGFPELDARGVKVAEHTGGELVEDPGTVDRSPDPVDRAGVERFLEQCLPGVSMRLTDTSVCMYTNSPDKHFIVDRHPEHPQVSFAAGLSGHGFKFASILGQVLADLALEGCTEQPIGFLSVQRKREW